MITTQDRINNMSVLAFGKWCNFNFEWWNEGHGSGAYDGGEFGGRGLVGLHGAGMTGFVEESVVYGVRPKDIKRINALYQDGIRL